MADVIRSVVPGKLKLGNRAVEKHQIRSFADLGGAWGVGGAYTFDLVEKHGIERAYIVDVLPSNRVRRQIKNFPHVSQARGFFGDPQVVAQVQGVEALLMYDILLHQANPRWDDILNIWAPKARVLVVYNQMWTDGDESIRFIERGVDWYIESLVAERRAVPTREWFSRHGEIDPQTGNPVEDQHRYWQWGITRRDLTETLRGLGFSLDYYEDFGPFRSVSTPYVRNEGYIFVRRSAAS